MKLWKVLDLVDACCLLVGMTTVCCGRGLNWPVASGQKGVLLK